MGLERLNQWYDELGMKKQYFGKRKNWARRMVEEHSLTKPGDTVRADYWNHEYEITIGPRGGIQIIGALPWQGADGWRWFEKTASQRKKG